MQASVAGDYQDALIDTRGPKQHSKGPLSVTTELTEDAPGIDPAAEQACLILLRSSPVLTCHGITIMPLLLIGSHLVVQVHDEGLQAADPLAAPRQRLRIRLCTIAYHHDADMVSQLASVVFYAARRVLTGLA